MDSDKEIARQINNLIKSKFSTYVYFENKEETAGQSGLEFFKQIFDINSRIVVILFNNNWGKTPMTNKEETIIRNRIVSEDWRFIILVKLNKNLKTPD
ncbi:MAG: hypothetical protein ABI550_07925 [Ignavibacteriaceae bacterium]